MIRSLGTLLFGVVVAVGIVVVAGLAAIYVLGLAAKAALFGEPRASLAMKVLERVIRKGNSSTDITHITPRNGGNKSNQQAEGKA